MNAGGDAKIDNACNPLKKLDDGYAESCRIIADKCKAQKDSGKTTFRLRKVDGTPMPPIYGYDDCLNAARAITERYGPFSRFKKSSPTPTPLSSAATGAPDKAPSCPAATCFVLSFDDVGFRPKEGEKRQSTVTFMALIDGVRRGGNFTIAYECNKSGVNNFLLRYRILDGDGRQLGKERTFSFAKGSGRWTKNVGFQLGFRQRGNTKDLAYVRTVKVSR